MGALPLVEPCFLDSCAAVWRQLLGRQPKPKKGDQDHPWALVFSLYLGPRSALCGWKFLILCRHSATPARFKMPGGSSSLCEVLSDGRVLWSEAPLRPFGPSARPMVPQIPTLQPGFAPETIIQDPTGHNRTSHNPRIQDPKALALDAMKTSCSSFQAPGEPVFSLGGHHPPSNGIPAPTLYKDLATKNMQQRGSMVKRDAVVSALLSRIHLLM